MPTGNRSKIFSWALFDFAHTAYSIIIVTFVYALYFRDVVAGGTGMGDFYWGIAVSLSMLLAALLSPPLGAAADSSQRKKSFLLVFTLVSVTATALLFFVQAGMILAGTLLFILANAGYEGGIVFYDAFLPEITSARSYGRVSGYGFAMGYLGSFAILAITLPLISGGFEPANLLSIRYSFVIAAAFFFIFSIPLFLIVKERHAGGMHWTFIREGFVRVRNTIGHLREHKNVAWFLIAFFIYNDGILTVITFSSIFAKDTLHFSMSELVIFFLMVQSMGVLGSIVFGIITDHIGAKKTITITLLLWIFVAVAAYFVDTKLGFYAIGALAGISLGSSQSASRSLMAHLTPKEREAEFFGFYDGLCGKASAVIGPFAFGLMSRFFGQRPAVVSVGLFFIVGLLLLQRVKGERREQFPAPAEQTN
ncbi:MAG TPA: MFS transporter [Candidatus Kapabacteria bacterium]|nr:MFS transporter [Candidatus Kapabacteria bacterium]